LVFRSLVLVALAGVLVYVLSLPPKSDIRGESDGTRAAADDAATGGDVGDGGPDNATGSAAVAEPVAQADRAAELPVGRLPEGVRLPREYIWISRERLLELPTEGAAWDNLTKAAQKPLMPPDVSDQDDPANVHLLAKALVYARTGRESYRDTVIQACLLAIGTEAGGRTLALGKELMAYVLAADLVGMPADKDAEFRAWLRDVRDKELQDKTLRSTHEDRPNNWGTYAGATRAAIAAYLYDRADFARAARVFKGWLGDRAAYAGFRYKELTWQADPNAPVGINPAGATKQGHPIGGVLPDDQRRSGSFTWPPPKANYVYTALQGALAHAVILHNAGYDVWQWQDRALLRAFRWLHAHADYPAEGDDTWQPHVINYYYDAADFPAPIPSEPGKNVGWTDWTHGPKAREG
jgi:hypothetical protein